MVPPTEADQASVGLADTDDVRQGYLSRDTFTGKPVTFAVVEGVAVFEGCIDLGRPEDLVEAPRKTTTVEPVEVFGVVIPFPESRWPNGRVPFVIDDDLPDEDRVREAMAHWEENTRIRFVERTSANADDHPDYVRFVDSDRCSSAVGRLRSGEQRIRLADGCDRGSAIHEIGHAVGLWHEQSREDRDDHVTINWENIEEDREHNFNQHITDGDDVGPYDYHSIMHYGPTAFSTDGDTITPVIDDVEIGQRETLSPGDCQAVRFMYRALEPPPTRTWHGIQFTANLRSRETQRWFTHSWPAHYFVVWDVIPTSPIRDRAAQVDWQHGLERQDGGLLKHWLTIRNLTREPITVQARFTVLGWSIRFR